MHEVYTAEGLVNVQVGRDLTQVKRIIGSGGYLSNVQQIHPAPWLAKMPVDAAGKRILLPVNAAYYRDEQYLIPLLANVAQQFPAEAYSACKVFGWLIQHLVKQLLFLAWAW